jgi:hypothetical protein
MVWLSALGGEARTAIPLAIPRPVFVARPQRVKRDALGRVDAVYAASTDANLGEAILTEWLYRIGADDPDYAFVLRRGSAVPMLVAADWIHHASRVVSLPNAQPASAERVA